MTQVEQLKQALANWDRASEYYDNLGAADTEPECVFQSLLVKAFRGDDVTVPTSAHQWSLFTYSMNCDAAAHALYVAAQDVVDVIQNCPVKYLKYLKPILSDYCWRVRL